MAKELATQLIEQLQAAGVQRIYGIVGDSLNPVVDAVRKTGGAAKGGIDWIHVRHEEAAAFAAAAEAQLTGRLAVCAGSCGPGNLHLINGLYDANRSGAPVLAIASHIPSSADRHAATSRRPTPTGCSSSARCYCEMISHRGAGAAGHASRPSSTPSALRGVAVRDPARRHRRTRGRRRRPRRCRIPAGARVTPDPRRACRRWPTRSTMRARSRSSPAPASRGAHDEVIAFAERVERARRALRCAARSSSSTTTRTTSA